MKSTSFAAPVARPAILSVKLGGIAHQKPIPTKFAFGQSDGKVKSKNADNISPAISWQGAPPGTKSFAIIVVDKDVPATFDDANQDGKTIPVDFPRQNFYHWLLVDIPATTIGFPEGKDSSGITPGGKKLGATGYGVCGQNDYAKVMDGEWGGYDGPCPPWNDERLHHYHFQVYALDVPTLGLKGAFRGKQVEDAMKDHVLAFGEVVGTYTQCAKLLK